MNSVFNTFGSMTIQPSHHVDDYDKILRTWNERLFSWPWRPWVKFNRVHNPKFYKYKAPNGGARIVCSYASYEELRRGL